MSGQLTMKATKMPRILSPCLHAPPKKNATSIAAEGDKTPVVQRYAEMHTNSRDLVQLIFERDHILHAMREWLRRREFMEVQTPVLSTSEGGALARAFRTSATEFSDRKLALRIAPELWLKRLILGGMERIFEIGPCFRNEGSYDQSHA